MYIYFFDKLDFIFVQIGHTRDQNQQIVNYVKMLILTTYPNDTFSCCLMFALDKSKAKSVLSLYSIIEVYLIEYILQLILVHTSSLLQLKYTVNLNTLVP